MLSRADALELVQDRLFPALLRERERLDQIDLWYRWPHEDVRIPRGATPELRSLLQLAKTPWLGLVVTTVAQALFVDGYRTPAGPAEGPWRRWQANDLDGRQVAVHRAALAYGQCYATALPGEMSNGDPSTVLRGVSPRKMLAFYDDPAEDDWPTLALRAERHGGSMRLYDDEAVHMLGAEQGKLVYIEERRHDVGVCPVVRFANMLDLDGRSYGEVEPLISTARYLDKTRYDLLLTQHYSSWKVRTVAGMAEPDSEEEANRKKLQLRQDDLLVAEDPDTKFGSLAETPLDGFIRAYESGLKSLAAVSQTPVNAIVGDMINVSAEGLAAARASLDAKVAERQRSFGKSWEQLLKLGALIDGDTGSAGDVMAHVTWADTSIRSLASAADALGKIASMLSVPVEALWPMIPGVSATDVQEWRALADRGGGLEALMRELASAQ